MDLSPTLSEPSELHDDVRSLAGGTGIVAAGTIIGRLIHVLTDIWLARLLGPAWFGIYSIAWNLHRLLSLVFTVGIPNGILVFGVKYWKKDNAKLTSLFVVSTLAILVSGLISAAGLWFSADWLAVAAFGKPEAAGAIKTVGLIMPFYLLLNSTGSMTRITRRMKYSVISSELITTLSMLAVFAVLYWLTGQFWAVLASMVVSYALAALVCSYFVRRLFPEIHLAEISMWRPVFKELFAFSIPTMAAGIFGATDGWLNRVLAGVYFPSSQVGIYQAASQFNNLYSILLGSVVSTFMPFVAKLYQSGDQARLNELYKVTTKWSLYINLPVVIVALLLPRQVMNLFYGNQYVQGYYLLVILTIGQLVNVGTGATSALFLMTGRQRNYLVLTIISFCFNIFGSIALIPWLGISAMAIGQLLASLVDNVAGTLWLAFDAKLWPYDFRYFKGILASLAMAAVVWWLPTPFTSLFLVIGLRAGLGLVVFILVLWLLGLDVEDRTFLSEVLRMTFRKLLPERQKS